MGKCCQLVIGPAGSGKSTFCGQMQQYLTDSRGRSSVHVVNLDPAAEGKLQYESSIDIRELVTSDDMVSAYAFGPNGALMACLEYLGENLDWLDEKLADYDDDYLIVDCPGQIELYGHYPVMRKLAMHMAHAGYRICVVCCLDASFIGDVTKFVSGCFVCLAAMCSLEQPHINVITKCDLLDDGVQNEDLQRLLNSGRAELDEMLDESVKDPQQRLLNGAIAQLLDEFSLVSFDAVNWEDQDSTDELVMKIDEILQYHDDAEPHDDFPGDMDGPGDDGDGDDDVDIVRLEESLREAWS